MITTVDPERLVMQWQPIETAPRDGTVILGYDPSWYDIATPMLFDAKRERFVYFHDPSEKIYPRHWMPMPDLPVSS